MPKGILADILVSVAILASLMLIAECLTRAEDAPFQMDTLLTQGNVSVQCTHVDLSSWGGPFALTPPQHRCLLTTTSPDTAFLEVTVNTRNQAGVITSATVRTAVENGHSIAVFPSRDVLASVTVQEIKAMIRFGTQSE